MEGIADCFTGSMKIKLARVRPAENCFSPEHRDFERIVGLMRHTDGICRRPEELDPEHRQNTPAQLIQGCNVVV